MRLLACGQLDLEGTDSQQDEDELERMLAAVGLRLEGDAPKQPIYHLWPENKQLFELWMQVQTQWLFAEGIRTGLNYLSVEAVLRIFRVNGAKRTEYFLEIQNMENAALDEWSKQLGKR